MQTTSTPHELGLQNGPVPSNRTQREEYFAGVAKLAEQEASVVYRHIQDTLAGAISEGDKVYYTNDQLGVVPCIVLSVSEAGNEDETLYDLEPLEGVGTEFEEVLEEVGGDSVFADEEEALKTHERFDLSEFSDED
jgi:hypothetical protein